MTDTKALKNWIDDNGLKIKAIAKAIGITPYALSMKINNEREFKASEIAAFVDIFGMTPTMRDRIFFASV